MKQQDTHDAFLNVVARHYYDEVKRKAATAGEPSSLPFTRILFCFPNRRSSLFFTYYLKGIFQTEDDEKHIPHCLPDLTTVSDIFGMFSHRRVPSRTSLLFLLYEVYGQVFAAHNAGRAPESFDAFVYWGDMLLSDFNDVDCYLVPPEKLFHNVSDLKEIDDRYADLAPEQVEAIRHFWKSYKGSSHAAEGEGSHTVFRETWALLLPLYTAFRQALDARGWAYEGMLEREVIARFAAQSAASLKALLPYEKVVFVGLNALSLTEQTLMQQLQEWGIGECCWNYPAPYFSADNYDVLKSANFFSRRNLQRFPNVLSADELNRGCSAAPSLSLYAVPSAVGQVRTAAALLQQWHPHESPIAPNRTAVVLPDESLLLPMLYEVPENLDNFNVTIGYPLRTTPIAAFVTLVAELQDTARENEAHETLFAQKTVSRLLTHRFTTFFAGEVEQRLVAALSGRTLTHLTSDTFAHCAPFVKALFRPVSTAAEALQYLLTLFHFLLPEEEGGDTLAALGDTEHEFVYHYYKVVEALQEEVTHSPVTFSTHTLFQLLDRLTHGETAAFSGEPLKGLQVMGMLETRSLDFENVVILSMNEGVMPAATVLNSFIPATLRNAFGIPTESHRDAIFSSYFYSLIARARRVALIYDSRADTTHTGEESRYIKQLRYLLSGDANALAPVSPTFSVTALTPGEAIEVEKTGEVYDSLMAFCEAPDGQGSCHARSLSVSALKAYLTCPLRFYLLYVKGLNEREESDSLDAPLFGDILHQVMCCFYRPLAGGKEIPKARMEEHVAHPNERLDKLIVEAFREMQLDITEGYNRLAAGLVREYACDIVKHDINLLPLRYLSGENGVEQGQHAVPVVAHYPIDEERVVRLSFIIDRLDETDDETVRVIDYKTGNSIGGKKNAFGNIKALFTPQSDASLEAFQVMLYCLLLPYLTPDDLARLHLKRTPSHLAPHLYFVRDFRKRQHNTHLLVGKDKDPITDFAPYQHEVAQGLTSLLNEILDTHIPFRQCEDRTQCQSLNCPFRKQCGR